MRKVTRVLPGGTRSFSWWGRGEGKDTGHDDCHLLGTVFTCMIFYPLKLLSWC